SPAPTMKFTLGFALLAAAVASTTATATLDAQRKLAFAPGYTGPPCGDTLCDNNYKPVCGSDGITYTNECTLGITSCNQETNVTMAHEGACASTPSPTYPAGCPISCPDTYVPVYDENGKEFSNECYKKMSKCRPPIAN
ncbi:protease inhibitor Epi10, partial [Phytophthora megakarya]